MTNSPGKNATLISPAKLAASKVAWRDALTDTPQNPSNTSGHQQDNVPAGKVPLAETMVLSRCAKPQENAYSDAAIIEACAELARAYPDRAAEVTLSNIAPYPDHKPTLIIVSRRG